MCHLAHMALKLWNNRSAHGETRERAKAASRVPFPSDARPRSIIANGGPSSHSTGCRVGALVAEWILGDGWRNVVTTSSPTSSLATNILYRSLHLHIPPPRQGFKIKKWQNWKRQLTNASVINCLRSPTKNLFQRPRLSEASSPVGFKTTPSVVSLREEGSFCR